jgi:sulfite exporter TauE/SafE
MIITITLLSAAMVTGLFGSIHCIGMCGGVVGVLTLGLSPPMKQSFLNLLPYLLTYNLGRISSYMLAGGLVGWLGSQFQPWLPIQVHVWISGLFMIVLGLYISGWWSGLVKLEKLGSYLWQRLSPLGHYFLPVNNLFRALGLGIVWGWLPCGLVYTALALSLAAGSAMAGGLVMLAFGLGTLPMLLAMGSATQWLIEFTRQPVVRRMMGALIILLGIYTLLGFSHLIHPRIQGIEMCYF